jgi:hypothetical protein
MRRQTRKSKPSMKSCTMQSSQVLSYCCTGGLSADFFHRVPPLLPDGRCIRRGHDISSRPQIRKEESPDLLIHLLNSRICFCHVGQGFWNCCETDSGGQQSVHTSINICVRHLNRSLYSDADELFQQGFEPVPHIYVSNGITPL